MTTEQAHFERRPDPARDWRPEPAPLFSVAERLALWSLQFGKPATAREWEAALAAGMVRSPQAEAEIAS